MSDTKTAADETMTAMAETPRAVVVHDAELFKLMGVSRQVAAMEAKGWTVDAEYCLNSWEFVFTVTVPDVSRDDALPIIVRHREGKPDRPWKRVVTELQERRLWPG